MTASALVGSAPTQPVDDLVEFVLAETVTPVDRWAVAATLESRGLRDVDAAERYGRADIFDLADEVLAHCRARLAASHRPGPEATPRLALHRRLARFVVFYLRGTFFALPMAVQIVSVVALGYGLWAYLRFDNSSATAVAVGTIASFVVTGGFVQAIGRLGIFYSEQKSHVLARAVCYRLVRAGLLATGAVGVLWWFVDLLTLALPLRLTALALVYYGLLSCYWLLLAVLYTMQRRLAVLASSVAGIGTIVLTRTLTPLAISAAHWIGLLVAIGVAALWGRSVLGRRAATVAGDMKLAKLPRAAVLAYGVAPYFLYGLLYFAFLFLDRVVGWSAGPQPLPAMIWFRTPYELGLDWALLSMVPTVALLEYTINQFSALIIPAQKRFSVLEIPAHNRFFRRFYLRQVVVLAAVAVVSVVATYRGVVSLRRFDDWEQVRDFFASPTTFSVFFWGALGYSLLVLGLMNGVFFFSLARVWLPLRALAAGAGVSLAVGFVLSRVFEYWYSAVGLAAGAVVFAALTTRHALRVLRKLDYYYYSAY